ncbi:hypothetical protein DSC45_28535 [Streptomyces sp. YIM 130001]|uniref:hypothetical protein n=1 Tax=Streptomyces sp. YIM 130001 TaxID=2259644 RepID=UPI000E64F0A0|nr:hypothetical protein [Streptomyces sp. YIM 130001]RII11239.1 hypothetical protein DSC45_28535 [Streptomyces sp. YIM 130001]
MVRGRGRTAAVWATALWVAVAAPAQAHAAAEPVPYAFEDGARSVQGGSTPSQAEELDADTAYRSSIGPDERLVYRVELDARSSAYVSAVAVPELGSDVTYADGIKVTLESGDGMRCGSQDRRFGSARHPRPLAATADRTIKGNAGRCSRAGTYDVVVERTGADRSAADSWELELNFHEEPPLKSGGGATEAPENANSAPPEVPSGDAESVRGGSGFSSAAAVGAGVWKDRIAAGETRFYRVPLGWGQQMSARAELNDVADSGPAPGALALSLANPVRGEVASEAVSSPGEQPQVALEALPPVDFANRFSPRSEVKAVRFPGQYYLQVTASPELRGDAGGEDLGVTLRVGVRGEAADTPVYAGDAGIFQVDPESDEGGAGGPGAAGGGSDDSMKVVAAAGIGTGTLLVLGLGVWTVVARRRGAVA